MTATQVEIIEVEVEPSSMTSDSSARSQGGGGGVWDGGSAECATPGGRSSFFGDKAPRVVRVCGEYESIGLEDFATSNGSDRRVLATARARTYCDVMSLPTSQLVKAIEFDAKEQLRKMREAVADVKRKDEVSASARPDLRQRFRKAANLARVASMKAKPGGKNRVSGTERISRTSGTDADSSHRAEPPATGGAPSHSVNEVDDYVSEQ